MSEIAVIIPAGGVGTRMAAGLPKQFIPLAGIPVLARSVQVFRKFSEFAPIIVVAPAAHLAETRALLDQYVPEAGIILVSGGESRQKSVLAGLAALPPEVEWVVIHDGVRPMLEPVLVDACLAAARDCGAALLAVPVKDTVKEIGAGGVVTATVERRRLWLAQTPQIARRDLLDKAFCSAEQEGFSGTDEASLLERIGCEVRVVLGSEFNFKITGPEDLRLAESLINKLPGERMGILRIGHGYDAHRLGDGRRLVLGGVDIPFERGLVGHSDADVLLHALCDALLGAAGLGDIGRHFPDDDPCLKGISSLLLLEKVVAKLRAAGFQPGNVDVTMVAQRPKLAPYFPLMLEKISRACDLPPGQINLKATTTEKMGFAGREEGIAAHAVVMIAQI